MSKPEDKFTFPTEVKNASMVWRDYLPYERKEALDFLRIHQDDIVSLQAALSASEQRQASFAQAFRDLAKKIPGAAIPNDGERLSFNKLQPIAKCLDKLLTDHQELKVRYKALLDWATDVTDWNDNIPSPPLGHRKARQLACPATSTPGCTWPDCECRGNPRK